MRRQAALHLICLLLIGAPARADWLMGHVVAIADGDTLTILTTDQDVGLRQVEAGLAWHYKRYKQEQSDWDRAAYARAEVRARDERRGLWRDPKPDPPWDFRRPLTAASMMVPPPPVREPCRPAGSLAIPIPRLTAPPPVDYPKSGSPRA